ncbi:MAG: COX15/CtaA family protein [Microbacteriaceae bacterium]|nr:COX15/CtaA family protein [Burkholderiaceae bacterium]
MPAASLVDFSPALRLALLAAVLALLPLSWWWLRQRGAAIDRRLAALTALTLFLTFDLIVFGSFTRLTDSGLGCPDWPGCYGEASPWGARDDIAVAQSALPSGPVTVAKAWIEMIHRYLAMAVGVLILVAAVASWPARRALPHSPVWAIATLVWVVVQGLFGKYTVTLKLYPAIVTLHLLGAMVLLALLVLQHESFRRRPLVLPGWPHAARWVGVTGVLVGLQVALGGWVSTNYAVLACTGFPACNGQWWPAMDVAQGFTLLRELGRAGHGGYLTFDALVAIHMAHRLFSVVVLGVLVWLAVRLWRQPAAAARGPALALAGLLVWQAASGLSNVVLGWPIGAALAHSGGAAALVGLLTSLWARCRAGATLPAEAQARHTAPPVGPAPATGSALPRIRASR